MKIGWPSKLDAGGVIHYSQCWEDPRTLTRALEIIPEDDVLSIASGGDNTFALLLERPKTLTAIDRNLAQLFLVELKIRAIQLFDHKDFISFLGARECNCRMRLYRHLRPCLSEAARSYWDSWQEWIALGVIHCGKFERYFALFRRFVLPMIHNQKNVQQLLNLEGVAEQQDFYKRVWENRRWNWLFQIFFGKLLLGSLGRHPSLFQYVSLNNIASELFKRTKRGLTEIPTIENYFLEYILTGQYDDLEQAHPYLHPLNFGLLRELVGEIRLVHGDAEEYLRSLPQGSLSKVNCSDVFEYMSDAAFERTLCALIRACRDDARMAFWTLFVPRQLPDKLDRVADPCGEISERLNRSDRTFFYRSFHLWRVGNKVSDEIVTNNSIHHVRARSEQ